MIRLTLLTLLIAYLSAYAWKDWFRGACWLVLLMAVFQHPDMPKSIAGIPGLNHWNFLFLNVVCSWVINRKKAKFSWEMPTHLNVLLFFYSLVIIISVLRYLNDHSGIDDFIARFGGGAYLGFGAINEYIINGFKWVVPAMLIFDGCKSRKQYNFAVLTLALMFLLLAIQVVKAMKLGSLTLSGNELQIKALKILSKSVGFHRVNVSMMMSGAFWLVFCLKEYVTNRQFILFIIPSCVCIFLAMAMTGGRTGYATWAILGFIFCVCKWRKYLLLAPVVLILITIVAPSAVERMLMGVVEQKSEEITHKPQKIDYDSGERDMSLITSGRILAWPLVWESIKEAPYIGYGKEAMKNIGISQQIMEEYGIGETFPHPHNAYLQLLQDNGVIGSLPIFIFYILMVKYSWQLFRDDSETIYVVTGGISLSLLLSFLIASTGSQTFYPREGAVGMWVGIGLMLRVYIERKKKQAGGESTLINR